ncbi:hypothetical protein Ciccas_010311 [Cichlidogyrus casuarinus]|uniref:Uncharacterized protein n=1 Tax=Cichlidogyrus casuarinus TaxID=1844966 RepID=A0ABD2PUI4_9PLAT
MSLIVELQNLYGMGKHEHVFVQAKVRDKKQTSEPVKGSDTLKFDSNKSLVWQLARPLDVTESMELAVYDYSKYAHNSKGKCVLFCLNLNGISDITEKYSSILLNSHANLA